VRLVLAPNPTCCRLETGVIETFAGTGERGCQDGNLSTAQFANPCGIATFSDKMVVISDTNNHRICRIALDQGTVETLAGTGRPGMTEGDVAVSQLSRPHGVAVDRAGNIVVADTSNHRIRRIETGTSVIQTLAGTGEPNFNDGPGTEACFAAPCGVTFLDGDVLVGDSENARVRRIAADGVVGTLSGTGKRSHADGPTLEAEFRFPGWLAASPHGVFVVDTSNQRIRRIADGAVTTVAGTGGRGWRDGPAMESAFDGPYGICADRDALYIADTGNNCIRRFEV